MPVLHHNVALLRVADPGVIEEIRAVLPLDAYVVGWISPTEAVLDPAELKTLLEEIGRAHV